MVKNKIARPVVRRLTYKPKSKPVNRLCAKAGVGSLVFLTDRRRVADPASVIDNLPTGTKVIYRDYDDPNRRETALILSRLCRQKGLIFYVAGDAKLARQVGADGVHLPDYQLTRLPLYFGLKVSAACHSRRSINTAKQIGADMLLVSPLFATTSGANKKAMGPHRFARLTKGAQNIYALAGITQRNAGQLKGIKIAGIAAISGVAKTR